LGWIDKNKTGFRLIIETTKLYVWLLRE